MNASQVAPEPLEYRWADARDIVPVQELFGEHLRALGYSPEETLDADILTFPAAYQTPPNAFLLVLAAGAGAVGMGGIRGGEVCRLFVRPLYRRRGVAREIVRRLADRCRQAGGPAPYAVVDAPNEAAARFFASLGFARRAPVADPRKPGCYFWTGPDAASGAWSPQNSNHAIC